jgi:hypothetical protein
MEKPSYRVEIHIDGFICVQKHVRDISCFIFYGDLIYNDEGRFQTKNAETFPFEDCFPYVDDQYIWKLDDDMSIDWSHPSEDDFSQYSHDGFQSHFGTSDAYAFGHLDLLYNEDFNPPVCSNFGGHEALASPEK